MAEPPAIPPADLLLNQHPIALRMGAITENILDFYEIVASPKSEEELKLVEEMFQKFPKACAAKLRIAPTLLNKVLPNRSVRTTHVAPTTDTPKVTNITAKELHSMNLPMDVIRRIAGMAGIEEAEIDETN